MDVSGEPACLGGPCAGGCARPFEGWRSSRRRRPSGQPPPLPHHVQTTGVGWLTAAVVLVALSLVVFAGGLRGPAVAVTVSMTRSSGGWPIWTGPGCPVDAGGGGAGFLGGDHRAAVGSAAGPADPPAAAAPARRGGRLDPAGIGHPVHARAAVAAAAAVRGGVPDRLVRMGVAVRTDRSAGRRLWSGSCTPWCPRAAGAGREVDGDGAGGAGRGRPYAPRGGGAHRRAGGCRGRGGDSVARLSSVHPERGLPGDLPAGPERPPGCRWRARGGDPPGAGGPTRPGGRRGRTVRAGRLGRIDPAAHQVKGDPPSGCSASSTPAATCAPTAGTSSAASCSTAGWRTRSRSTPCAGWSSRRTTRCTDAARRAAQPAPYGFVELTPEREYLLVTEFFDGATELGEAEVDDASSTTACGSSASSGTPAWRTATSSRPTCWSATASCC